MAKRAKKIGVVAAWMSGQIGRSGATETGFGTITFVLSSTMTPMVGAIAARTISTTATTSMSTDVRRPLAGTRPFGRTIVIARNPRYVVHPAQLTTQTISTSRTDPSPRSTPGTSTSEGNVVAMNPKAIRTSNQPTTLRGRSMTRMAPTDM